MLDGHIHNDHLTAIGDALPVDSSRRKAGAVMSGQEGHCLIDITMGHGNTGIGQPADTCRHTGEDAQRHPGLTVSVLLRRHGQRQRDPALEPQHTFVFSRQLDQPQGDIALQR